MPGTVVEIGDKLHIATRRLFEEDVRRHFAGEVTAVSDTLVEVRGYTFVFQPGSNEYRRLPDVRTRLFSLGDSGHVVNKIAKNTELSAVAYRTVDGRVVVSDGKGFTLQINEFGANR